MMHREWMHRQFSLRLLRNLFLEVFRSERRREPRRQDLRWSSTEHTLNEQRMAGFKALPSFDVFTTCRLEGCRRLAPIQTVGDAVGQTDVGHLNLSHPRASAMVMNISDAGMMTSAYSWLYVALSLLMVAMVFLMPATCRRIYLSSVSSRRLSDAMRTLKNSSRLLE